MSDYIKKIVICLGLSFMILMQVLAKNDISILSPNGSIRCLLSVENRQLFLSVLLNDRQVLEKSPLHMLVDGAELTDKVITGKIKRRTVSETYACYWLHSEAINHCNCVYIELKNPLLKADYNLEVRVFDNAVGFRFIVPGDETAFRKPDESTVFILPSRSLTWYHDLYMHYEGVHIKRMIDTVPSGQWAAPPLTIKLPDNAGYTSITEANLTNYAGMALQTDGKSGFTVRLGHSHPASYPYVLRYSKEDVERLSKIAEVKGTITTPWRVIMVGKDLNTLVNCAILQNLCSPPDTKLFPEGIKTSWIRPGRAVWKYLDGGGDGTLSVMKKFSKEAADLEFEYNILEGFWSRWPEDSIRALVDYSGKMNIGIIVWKHSKDLRDPVIRQEFFRHLHDLGIAGIKIDFFDHEAKEVIDLYESIAREAAAFKLFRMLAGPADYSVCHFGDRRKNTTWAHQVATAAIYSGPVITYAATPAHILENPCSEIIKSIPSVWDETIVLAPSEIGEVAIYAQRSGTTWFLSAINGLMPKSLNINLGFLKKGSYQTLALTDNEENNADALASKGTSSENDVVKINLSAGGGFIMRLTKH